MRVSRNFLKMKFACNLAKFCMVCKFSLSNACTTIVKRMVTAARPVVWVTKTAKNADFLGNCADFQRFWRRSSMKWYIMFFWQTLQWWLFARCMWLDFRQLEQILQLCISEILRATGSAKKCLQWSIKNSSTIIAHLSNNCTRSLRWRRTKIGA